LLLINSAFLIGNTVMGSGFGFLFWLVTARAYSPADVGLGAALISALTLLTALGELGLGTALIRFARGVGERRNGFINSVLAAAALGTLGLTLVFALCASLVAPELTELVRSPSLALFLISAVAFVLGQVLDSLFVAFQTTYFSFARNLTANVIRLAVVITVGRNYGAHGPLLAVGAAALATAAVALLLFAPRAAPGYRAGLVFDWRLLGNKLGYTLGNHFATLLWNVPTLVYPLIIVALLGASANAQFYISWMVANILLIVPTAISTSTFARAANQADITERTFWRTMWRTLLILTPLGGALAIAAPHVLQFFGTSYTAAGNTLFLCLVASSFPYAVNSFTIVYHRVRHHIWSVISVAGSITLLCLMLSTGLGLLFGLNGVGAGWLAGQTLGTLIALLSRRTRRASYNRSIAPAPALTYTTGGEE
jgi:O-antigen/teichoic acid export membrane protein